MKTMKITLTTLFVITAFFFLACDNMLTLGTKLDLQGPELTITAPTPRTAVPATFTLEGKVVDRSPIERMLVTATLNDIPFSKQWRYDANGWQIFDGGEWTALPDAQWNISDTTVDWLIPIDMTINGGPAQEGEYIFWVQTWDSGGMSHENSLRTITLIYDKEPPSVVVFNPYLYSRYLKYNGGTNKFSYSGISGPSADETDLNELHLLSGNDWREPALLGQFLTQEFKLQWQIIDDHDVKSIDLRFYDAATTTIDEDLITPLPDTYFYNIHQESDDSIKPNGTIMVPDLRDTPPGTYSGTYPVPSGQIKTNITTKKTIQVVALCYDAAGQPNQEKTIGYFIYWPEARDPWIEFPEGMKAPSYHYNPSQTEADFKKPATITSGGAYMVYPGRAIKSFAFQAQGVSKVEFSLYKWTPTNGIMLESGIAAEAEDLKETGVKDHNGNDIEVDPNSNNRRAIVRPAPRQNDSFPTTFSWGFEPEAKTAYYVIRATAYDFRGNPAMVSGVPVVEEAAFRVEDITYPDFPDLPYPSVTEPLFKYIGRADNGEPSYPNIPEGTLYNPDKTTSRPATLTPGKDIRISGIVTDATRIDSLYIVWINPNSKSYSAMSQLSYFRDENYAGWTAAKNWTNWPEYMPEGEYDPDNPNRVWKITNLTNIGEDPVTHRIRYWYYLDLSMRDDLKIGIGSSYQPLKSQVFLLRAENPDEKTKIITYAPQGDTVVPTIEITNVKVGGDTFIPRTGKAQIPRFTSGETITINGEWTEDSSEFLNGLNGDYAYYFYKNMKFTINDKEIAFTINPNNGNITTPSGSNTTVSITRTSYDDVAKVEKGKFAVTAIVGVDENSPNTINLTNLRDTLVVNASVVDIGGNPAEAGASWLVEGEKIKFLRISSDDEDRAYRAGEKIRLFIEFNKPVVLNANRSRDPVLLLQVNNTSGGGTINGTAAYDSGQNSAATKHYFTYTVGANHDTGSSNLNVTGIDAGGIAWQNANYPFTFVHIKIDDTPTEPSREEIRLTMDTTHATGTGNDRTGIDVTNTINPPAGILVFARLVTTTTTTSPDYNYTLAKNKAISVDNTAPAITGVIASPKGWHKADVELYITATFDTPVRIDEIDENDIPYLILGTGNSTEANRWTSRDPDDVRASDKQITFMYKVKAGDAAIADDLRVMGLGGKIMDVPGNAISTTNNWFITGTRTLEGVRLDTSAPAVPIVTVWEGTAPANNAAPPTGTTPLATSGNAAIPLGNLYHGSVFVRIAGVTNTSATVTENLGTLEYTLNGTDWSSPANLNNGAANIQLNNGPFTVRARQTDRAGNIATANEGESYNITFNLDTGALVTSINSTTPNGTYTYNATRQDQIEIQVNFRKELTFTANSIQTITLNAVTAAGGSTNVTVLLPIPASPTAGTKTNQLKFTYNVESGHNTNLGNPPALTRLAVTGLALTGVTDEESPVPAAFITLPALANRLQTLKEIYIRTGDLDVTSGPGFNDSLLTGATAGVQTDGTYNTALVVGFNRQIYRNTGNITITQSATNYRVPAVLTEAQYNKFRDVPGFNTYYTRGTNGYNGSGPDTATKFVLAYNFNTAVAPDENGSAEAKFAEHFRQAEKITLSVNSSAVRAVNVGSPATGTGQLIVDLAKSNALQVPGATYDVVIDANLVQDPLSNRSVAISVTPEAIGGVAKPFIRVLKKQDEITVNNNPSNTVPRFTAAQPLDTTARMDTRTPGATIYYFATQAATDTNAKNYSETNGPNDTNTPAAPGQPNDPQTTTAQRQTYNGVVTIGGDVTLTNVQGLRWYVRAKAQNGGTWSENSEEMAYRTVLTYAITNMSNGAPGQNFTQTGDTNTNTPGKHVWIRGGNALEVSTIPGFPLTWEDNWTTLRDEGRRAGIRLLTLVTTPTTNMNTSTWRWVTWEVNVDTYFDMILGYDPDSGDGTNAGNVKNIVTQYGPRQWAMQRAGWTSFKEQYRIFAGKHRYLTVDTGGTFAGQNKGPVNFSGTFQARPAMTGANDVTWTP